MEKMQTQKKVLRVKIWPEKI